MNLNEKQIEAINIIRGPLLILAGAGAGKTKTITERVINIIKSGVEPENILCVTFTNKAAKEMLERILIRMSEEKLIEKYEKDLWQNKNLPTIKTFHSLGLSILREHGKFLGFNKNISVVDPADVNQILKEIILNLSLDPKLHDVHKIKNIISREKSAGNTPLEYEKKIANYNMEIIGKVWKIYDKELEKRGVVDFDDLIIKSIEILKNESINKYYKDKFKYIHIDEYQDTNNLQYEFIKLLLNKREQNLCVVGDIDQNIYSWRGANIKNIMNFERDFPEGKIVLLEENYRSTQNILNLANISISKNKARFPKILFTNKKEGEAVEICPAFDEKREGEFITKKIIELREKNGELLKNFAVLYRTNFQSRILEESFIKAGIPYNLLGIKFFERKEVKNILSYLKVSKNRDSLEDLKRVLENPKRGIGKASIIKIFSKDESGISISTLNKIKNTYTFLDRIENEINNNQKKLSDIVNMIIINSGIENELLNDNLEGKERLENIRELVSITKKYDILKTSEAFDLFIEECSLRSDQDDDNEKDAVKLMTIHASKGLEFDYVFISGLEDDLFPHMVIGSVKKNQEEEEEERRLFYVAVTRAKKKLFLCYAETRTIYGEKKINIPSEFLADANELPSEKVVFNNTYYGESNIDTYKNNKKRYLDFKDDEYEEDFLEI